MGFPDLTLRFRDASKGEYRAIQEHLAILQTRGHVLWGWWRRQEEDERLDLWRTLKTPVSATLISPSEQLQYTVRIERIIFGPLGDDVEHVPSYYHEEAAHISVWLELSEISVAEFSDVLARKLANQTRTVFTSEDLLRLQVSYSSPLFLDSDSGNFVILSDIHLYQGEHNFLFPQESPAPSKAAPERLLTLAQAIRDDLARCKVDKVDGVFVCGDIVSRGTWPLDLAESLFKEISDLLRVPLTHIFCVPGNHDFYRQDKDPEKEAPIATYAHEHGYKNFRSQVFNVPPAEPLNYSISYLNKDFEVRVGFLNSARWSATPDFSEYGFVGRDMYRSVLAQMSSPPSKPLWKMLVLHHHVLPIRRVEHPGARPQKPVSLSLDSVDLLDDAQESAVDLIVHGHQHIPDFIRVARLDHNAGALHAGLHVLACGSAGSNQVQEARTNTYALLSFSANGVECRVRKLDGTGREKGDVFCVRMDK